MTEIGSAPSDESCARVGDDDYRRRARAECNAYSRQIARHYPPPENGRIFVKGFAHDFGRYFEVVIEGPCDWEAEVERDARNVLQNWDEQAKDELGL